MPTYSYKCKQCSHSFDALQSIKADALVECPECKGEIERMIGAGVGIHFKGSGFYVTDYKKSGNSSSEKSVTKTETSTNKTTTKTSTTAKPSSGTNTTSTKA